MVEEQSKYLSLSINVFKGVNLNVAPTLIEDTEARHILNLRVEKAGKLVTRNGYIYGAYINTIDAADTAGGNLNIQTFTNFDPTIVPLKQIGFPGYPPNLEAPLCGYPMCAGVLGFGEFKLENYWEAIDTDRILVVAIRHPYATTSNINSTSTNQFNNAANNLANQINQNITNALNQNTNYDFTDADIDDLRSFRNLMELLYIPLTGRYRNMILDPYYLFSGDPRLSYSLNKTNILNNSITYPGYAREQTPQSLNRINVLLFAPNRDTNFYTTAIRGWLNTATAPLRNSRRYSLNEIINIWEDRFDRRFVKMNQYRNYLVISDPINGDMNLTDEFDWQDDNCGNKYHRLRLAPNALEEFLIDKVSIDLRLNEGQENDLNRGVKRGLTLYRYKLKKNYTKVNVDHFDPTLTDGDFLRTNPLYWSGLDEDSKNNLKKQRELDVLTYLLTGKSSTLLVGIARSMYNKTTDSWLPGSPNDNEYLSAFQQIINNNPRRIFSNTNDLVEFDDILSELEFYDELEQIQEEETGNVYKSRIRFADPYTWDEFQITYYPTLGRNNQNIIYPYLLREFDRTFDKIFGRVPRVMQIRRKRSAGQFAPLGVWQYKFVWDFGNGVFSAPSNTLNVPDIMWSAVTDAEITHRISNNYERFYNQRGAPGLNYTLGNQPTIPNDYNLSLPYFNPHIMNLNFASLATLGGFNYVDIISQTPYQLNGLTNYYLYRLQLFDPSSSFAVDPNLNFTWNINLTRVGQLVWDIKKRLYQGMTNRFGNPGYYYTSDDSLNINQVAQINPFVIVDFYTMITCFFSQTDVATKGFAWQYVKLDYEKWRSGVYEDSNPISDEVKFEMGPLVIPIFPHGASPQSHLSLFDEEGRLRLSILAPTFYNIENRIRYVPNKFYSLPWIFHTTRHIDERWQSNDTIPKNLTILREPFYPWMQMYIMFYSDIDYNNLDSVFFKNEDLPILTLYSHIPTNSPQGSKWFYSSQRSQGVQYFQWVTNYVLRPTAPIRAIKKENDPSCLNLVNSDIPNDVSSRLVLEGVMELELIKPWEILLPFSFGQFAYVNGPSFDNEVLLQYGNIPAMYFEPSYIWGPYFFWRHQDKFDYIIPLDGDPSNLPLRLKIIWPYDNPWREFYFYYNHQKIYKFNSVYYNFGPFKRALPNFDGNWIQYLRKAGITNISLYLYGQAQRLILLEQLSSIFPSSVLFRAPRIAIRIAQADVPLKAKKLLIFRTKSTNDNSYNPDEFGFVKEVEFIRDSQGNVITREKRPDGSVVEHLNEIYFFDDITDDNLDFSHTPDQYEGLRRPIKSRFNIPLNERVYYYNFIEEYQPLTPRIIQTEILTANSEKHPNNSTTIQQGYYNQNLMPSSVLYYVQTNGAGYDANSTYDIDYLIVYSDQLNINSQPQIANIVLPVTTQNKVVILALQPTPYRPDVKLKVYRRINFKDGQPIDNDFLYIGEVSPNLEGIFVDDYLPGKDELTCVDPVKMYYPTGLRWSKPYRPDWIEEDAFTEYKGGNIGTGLEVNYGNLVLFTDSSIARYTVQAENPPISRVDELTPEFGCVAPNSLVNNNNILFFLTFKGWMSYNNNIFKNVDEKFNNEIVTIINYLNRNLIREVTSGVNQTYNEVYLNFPPLLSNNPFFYLPEVFIDKINPVINGQVDEGIILQQRGRYFDFGDIPMHDHNRYVWGHIYVLNYLLPYSTKFGYLLTLRRPNIISSSFLEYIKDVTHPLQPVRLYFTDSFGKMWSGDIYPNVYYREGGSIPTGLPIPFWWAAIYIESPIETVVNGQPLYLTTLNLNPPQTNRVIVSFTDEDVYPVAPRTIPLATGNMFFYDFGFYGFGNVTLFPNPYFSPVKWVFLSKFFTDNNETNLKRIRKTLFNLFTKGNFAINIQTLRLEENDTNIEDMNISGRLWFNWFNFDPNENYIDLLRRRSWQGRLNSIVSVIPSVNIFGTSPFGGGPPITIDDWNAKPTKTSLEIYGRKYAQINEIEVIWRHIHRYLL